MKILFLHIPKTAGQSVHAALEEAFDKDIICPARVNEQLQHISVSDLNKYTVFSGHFDWNKFDHITGQKYVFTVLRNPLDRILSFYFYLRNKAESFSPELREKPEHQGLKAVYELSPDEYFLGGAPHIRNFLDDNYDNFYMYYFAGRHYSARRELNAKIASGKLSHESVLNMAITNMSSLDNIYKLNDLTRLFDFIRNISGNESIGRDYRVNINKNIADTDRKARLIELGATHKALDRIDEFCQYDNILWDHFSN